MLQNLLDLVAFAEKDRAQPLKEFAAQKAMTVIKLTHGFAVYCKKHHKIILITITVCCLICTIRQKQQKNNSLVRVMSFLKSSTVTLWKSRLQQEY